MNWQHKIKVKHLLTEDEDWENVQKSMSAIADVIDNDTWFVAFRRTNEFRNIPKGDRYFHPEDYANQLLDALYDYADENAIWIE